MSDETQWGIFLGLETRALALSKSHPQSLCISGITYYFPALRHAYWWKPTARHFSEHNTLSLDKDLVLYNVASHFISHNHNPLGIAVFDLQ